MLRSLVLLVLFRTACFADKASDKCDEYKHRWSGLEAPQCRALTSSYNTLIEPRLFPANVLYFKAQEDGEIREFCNGVLVSDNSVLVTPSCMGGLLDINTDRSWIVKLKERWFGASDEWVRIAANTSIATWNVKQVQPSDIKVWKKLIHPEFNPDTLANDIAVLKLNTELDNSYVPACLDNSEATIGRTAVVVGTSWDVRRTPGLRSKTPIKGELPVVAVEECKASYLSTDDHPWTLDRDIADKFCSSGVAKGLGDCMEGPVYIRREACTHTVTGLKGYDKKCDTPRHRYLPAITSVSHHLDWIMENID